jgi:hypothetical protein
MADMGLPEFALSARALDADGLIQKFTELESRSTELELVLEESNKQRVHDVNRQFAELSSVLFASGGARRAVPDTEYTLTRL